MPKKKTGPVKQHPIVSRILKIVRDGGSIDATDFPYKPGKVAVRYKNEATAFMTSSENAAMAREMLLLETNSQPVQITNPEAPGEETPVRRLSTEAVRTLISLHNRCVSNEAYFLDVLDSDEAAALVEKMAQNESMVPLPGNPVCRPIGDILVAMANVVNNRVN
jgi:hypothetical protein